MKRKNRAYWPPNKWCDTDLIVCTLTVKHLRRTRNLLFFAYEHHLATVYHKPLAYTVLHFVEFSCCFFHLKHGYKDVVWCYCCTPSLSSFLSSLLLLCLPLLCDYTIQNTIQFDGIVWDDCILTTMPLFNWIKFLIIPQLEENRAKPEWDKSQSSEIKRYTREKKTQFQRHSPLNVI